ncbi:MAG: transposase [Candidatus Omnitrophica bacterium]|nr:transposase [Candidatus Omnitrophota bacterium]
MPRIARIVAIDHPHHITQRGNYRQNVFTNDADRKQYLEFIAYYAKKLHLEIISYCLMDNHVHFIAIPKHEDSLSKTFSIAHTRYSQYFNNKMSSSGHLWQGRFYSCVLDERHLMATARYIERNPVRAKIIKDPIDYMWSSAKCHANKSRTEIIDTSQLFRYIEIPQKDWKEFISEHDNPDEIARIRKSTITGRPLGSEHFIEKLEKVFDQRLRALPVGRPKKEEKK